MLSLIVETIDVCGFFVACLTLDPLEATGNIIQFNTFTNNVSVRKLINILKSTSIQIII